MSEHDLMALLADPHRAAGIPRADRLAVLDALAWHEGRCRLLRDQLTAGYLQAADCKGHVPGRLLTVGQAAAQTGMSKDWLYRNKGKLPFTRRIGRKVLFDEVTLAGWLATRCR